MEFFEVVYTHKSSKKLKPLKSYGLNTGAKNHWGQKTKRSAKNQICNPAITFERLNKKLSHQGSLEPL